MFRFDSNRALSVLAALVTLSGCAAKQAPQTIPLPGPANGAAAPAAVPEPATPVSDYEPLYARIDEHRRLYAEGIELIEAGDEVAGEEHIAQATNGLGQDALACAEQAGCEIGRFFAAFDALLAEQAIALKRQALRVADLEQSAEEDVEREPGTAAPPLGAELPVPALGRTTALLRGTDLREMIELNGPVKAAIVDWLTWMRPMLVESYWNYQFLRSKMVPAYEEAGLPEALLFAMLATETHARVHSFSRAGAAGPLQFIASTGRKYGLRVQDGFDMRLDPEASSRANVAYLNDQFAALSNLELVLAAYNGGEGRLQNLHRRYGSNLWDSRIYHALPRETREYVPRILAAAWLFLHPDDYNLEFPAVTGETAAVELAADLALDELAICLGQEGNPAGWFRTLRNLNPRLEPAERVKAGAKVELPASLVPVYEERCREGRLLEVARELHGASAPPEPKLERYTVRKGDTLARVASRFGCKSIVEIADLNRLRAPHYVIRAGQTLKIPDCD